MCADVAQLVAHHLAKVDVAGSSPVVRSNSRRSLFRNIDRRFFIGWSGREARHRTANPATRVQIPSPPPLFNLNPKAISRHDILDPSVLLLLGNQ